MGRTPTTFAQALQRMSERPTPALIWHDGEQRVELSGRVLVNWIEKTAGLLVDELEVEAGQIMTVSPRPHWRLVVLALAGLRVGMTVRCAETSVPDAAVHADLEADLDPCVPAQHVLAVATPALAFECDNPVPDGVVDFCAEVRSFPDVYTGFEEPGAADPALAELGISFENLLTEAARAASDADSPVVYLPLPRGWNEQALLVTLGVLFTPGAVLLASTGTDVSAEMLQQEKAVPLNPR